MIKYILTLFLINIFAISKNVNYNDALFATVVNVPTNDILNVREKPNYKSKKIGSLSPKDDYLLVVEKCEKKEKSIWCKIHLAELYDVDNFDIDKSGWVNAKYLTFYDNGYVLIDGIGNCDYSLECKDGFCELIDGIIYYPGIYVIKSTKRIKRERLSPTNHLGAMTEGGDGYCNIHSYLTKKESPKWLIAIFLEDLKTDNFNDIASLIDPTKGVILTDHISFGITDKVFTQNEFLNYLKNDKKVIKAFEDGKDEKQPTFLTIKEFLNSLHKNFDDLTNISTCKDFKGFKQTKDMKCFIVKWEDTEVAQNYLNLIVILKKYKNRWYIIGILKDRWTI